MSSPLTYLPIKWLRAYHKKYDLGNSNNGAIYQVKQINIEKNDDIDKLVNKKLKQDDVIILAGYHTVTYLMRILQPNPIEPYKSMDMLIKLCNTMISYFTGIGGINKQFQYIKRVLSFGTNNTSFVKSPIANEVEFDMNFNQQFINRIIGTDRELETYYLIIHHLSLIFSYVSDLNNSVSDITIYDEKLDSVLLQLMNNNELNPKWLFNDVLSDNELNVLVLKFKKMLGKSKTIQRKFIEWNGILKNTKPKKTTYFDMMIKMWNLSRFITRLAFGDGVKLGFLDMFNPKQMELSTFKIDTLFQPHIKLLDYVDQIYPMIKVTSMKDIKFYIVRPYKILSRILPSHLYYIVTENNVKKFIDLKKQSIKINNGTLTLTIQLKSSKKINSMIDHYFYRSVEERPKGLLFNIFKQSDQCNIQLKDMKLTDINKTLRSELERSFGVDFRKLDIERVHNFMVSFMNIYKNVYQEQLNEQNLSKLIKKDNVIGQFIKIMKDYPIKQSCTHTEIPITTIDIQLFLDHINNNKKNFGGHFVSKLSFHREGGSKNLDFIDMINDLTVLHTLKNGKLKALFFGINEKQVMEEALPLWCGFYFAISLFIHVGLSEFQQLKSKNSDWLKETLNELGRIISVSIISALEQRTPSELELSKHIFQFQILMEQIVMSSLSTLMKTLKASGNFGKKSMSMKKYRSKKQEPMKISEKEKYLEKKQKILELLLNENF